MVAAARSLKSKAGKSGRAPTLLDGFMPLIEAFIASECVDLRNELTPVVGNPRRRSLSRRLRALRHPHSLAGRAGEGNTLGGSIGHTVAAGALYDRLRAFCAARECQAPTQTLFGLALGRMGFHRGKSVRMVWIGLRLK